MMDYEKKYNEALERAKNIKSKILQSHLSTESCKAVSEYIDEIIPELRESEDERMMREFNDWLCEEIECLTNDLRDEKDRRTLNMLCYILTKVKDWLEKQKESLHISESCKENADSFTSEDERIRKELLDFVRSFWADHKEKLPQLSRWVTYLEKQKEKKPEIKYVYPKFRKGDVIEPITPNGHFTPVRVVDIWDGNYSCRSDDDKAYLILPIRNEDEYRLAEQKPAEWSEEDEKMLKSAIWHISNSVTNGKNTDCKCDLTEWLMNRLKSFRPQPHWKPSEGQMDALCLCIPKSGQPCTLQSLYNDLKKL